MRACYTRRAYTYAYTCTYPRRKRVRARERSRRGAHMHARAHVHVTFSDLSEEESGAKNEEKNEIKRRERKRIFTPSKVASNRTRRAPSARFARFIDPPLRAGLFWIDVRRFGVPPKEFAHHFATITPSPNGSPIRSDASHVSSESRGPRPADAPTQAPPATRNLSLSVAMLSNA